MTQPVDIEEGGRSSTMEKKYQVGKVVAGFQNRSHLISKILGYGFPRSGYWVSAVLGYEYGDSHCPKIEWVTDCLAKGIHVSMRSFRRVSWNFPVVFTAIKMSVRSVDKCSPCSVSAEFLSVSYWMSICGFWGWVELNSFALQKYNQQ